MESCSFLLQTFFITTQAMTGTTTPSRYAPFLLFVSMLVFIAYRLSVGKHKETALTIKHQVPYNRIRSLGPTDVFFASNYGCSTAGRQLPV